VSSIKNPQPMQNAYTLSRCDHLVPANVREFLTLIYEVVADKFSSEFWRYEI
jgi:hypothetical protein